MTLRAVLAVLLLAVPAAAQPVKPTEDPGAFDKELNTLFSPSGLTSAQAASRAVRTSPQIRARAAAVDAAIAQAETAELARIPFVGLTARYTRLSHIEPPDFGPGLGSLPVFDNQYLGEATAQINLSDYLVRYPKQIASARAAADAARLSKRANELDVAADARITYYEWVRAKLQTLVAKRQLEQVRATLGQVRALADAQRVSRADLMRVESEEAQADHAADRLQQLSELREEQLRILIGAAPTESLSIGEDVRVDITAPSTGQLDQLVAMATKQRYDYQAFDMNIEAVEKQRAAEKSSLFPRLSAFGVADYARPNQRIFPQEDKFEFTWQAGLQLTWTLNEALVSNAQDKRFAADLRELRANRESLERGTRIAVLSAQQAVDIAQRSFITSKKGLDAANESYRVRQALLAAQRATAVELVDAEANLTRARIAAVNARIDLRVALVELEHAIGADTKTDTK